MAPLAGSFVLALALVGLAGSPLLSAAARAEEPAAVTFHVTVVHVSGAEGEGGGVEESEAARRAHGILGDRIRYESLRVLATHERRLAANDVARIGLPTGRELRFRPLDVGEGGVLVAVDVEGTAQGDFRIPSGKPIVLGGPTYREGQLVILLEPRY